MFVLYLYLRRNPLGLPIYNCIKTIYMKRLTIELAFACLLISCGGGSQKNALPDTSAAAMPAADSGWTALFNGKDLSGWHTYGDTAVGSAWNIDSGAIHLQPGAKNGYQTKGGGDVVTDSAFGNFDCKISWKVGKKANSGIMFYVQDDKKKYPETWYTGPESQVLDIDSNEDAHSPKHQVADLYDLIPCTTHPANPWGQWNHVEIISNKGKLDILLNGVNVITTTLWDDNWKKLIANSKFKAMPGFGMFTTGHIALQDHGEEVWYKDIMIKKL
jgi:hypothetical protein